MDHLILALDTQALSPYTWYLTRTMAVGAFITLTGSVMLGIMRPMARDLGETLNRLFDMAHTFLAVASGVLAFGHLVTLLLDAYVPFTVLNLLLPLDQPYQPLAVNIGVFGMYAMAVVLLTSWLRSRLSYGLWRSIHYVSFVAFGLITLHGFLAGSDRGEGWLRGVYGGAVALVGFLLVVRIIASMRAAAESVAR